MDSPNSLPQPPNDASSQFVSKRHSRLTLTLPASRTSTKGLGKAQKAKATATAFPDVPNQKIPRPVKLKPLKEVLTKLITQVKKKDDYAFFLQPVDASKVPGYADVVKNPMDFGTMSNKVKNGRYRSLEEFAVDFRLVTSNARSFNPLGTIFHSEAARIEEWGLEQIARAASQVIEYETDWNIDVVADEDPAPAVDDADERANASTQADDRGAVDLGLRVKIDSEDGRAVRSPSVVSTIPGQSKRGAKNPSKKPANTISEFIDADGHLPGSKDGLGAFPPGSDMAALMLALKLKGKRYKTKKERMRVEKEGPPRLPDGSLDFTEMEDPFAILEFLVPDPPAQPILSSVLPTQQPPHPSVPSVQIPHDHLPGGQSRAIESPVPVAFPPESMSTLFPLHNKPGAVAAKSTGKKPRKHWNIIRNPPTRARARDGEDGDDATSSSRPNKRRRVAEATDYGAFSTLMGTIAAERGLGAVDIAKALGTESQLLEAIRESLDGHRQEHGASQAQVKTEKDNSGGDSTATSQQAREAEEYLRHIVYGGIDGYAYIRSVAEFVAGSPYEKEVKDEGGKIYPTGGLGMSLAQWVNEHVVSPLTAGHHTTLRKAVHSLYNPALPLSPTLRPYLHSVQPEDVELKDQLATLKGLSDSETKIDMSSLLRAPHELFAAEYEWAGVAFKAQKEKERENLESHLVQRDAAGFLAYAIENHRQAELASNANDTVAGAGRTNSTVGDSAEVIEHALGVGADAILEMNRRLLRQIPDDGGSKEKAVKDASEDPDLRKLRLNLLAVSKRAPLDKIARLPADLVPAHIRHIVPTLSA